MSIGVAFKPKNGFFLSPHWAKLFLEFNPVNYAMLVKNGIEKIKRDSEPYTLFTFFTQDETTVYKNEVKINKNGLIEDIENLIKNFEEREYYEACIILKKCIEHEKANNILWNSPNLRKKSSIMQALGNKE